MSILHRTPAVRWAVPVAVAALLIGGGAVVGTVTAGAAGTPLPARSAAQLVADVHASEITGLSGTVVQTSDLGIPELPSIGASPLPGGMGSSDLTALISGTHTLRLWYSGPQQIRLALLGSLGESDIIRNGPDLWIWSSTSNTATHRTLPERQPAATHGSSVTGPPGTGLPMSPQHAAALALRAISPSTAASTVRPTAAGPPSPGRTPRGPPRHRRSSARAGPACWSPVRTTTWVRCVPAPGRAGPPSNTRATRWAGCWPRCPGCPGRGAPAGCCARHCFPP
jgi:hypothetical protein